MVTSEKLYGCLGNNCTYFSKIDSVSEYFPVQTVIFTEIHTIIT